MKVNIVGGGLAGCECAYQLLKRGVAVEMFEMKKLKKSPAHTLDSLAELVCSNSLKSSDLTTASGLLKAELISLDSLLIAVAESLRVPAGNALAVDREKFADAVTKKLLAFENFTLTDAVVDKIEANDEITVVATGPLTDESLVPALQKIVGDDFLYFFDAVAPIVTTESIDLESAFFGSRYNKGSADYINCPMSKEGYLNFWEELVNAETVQIKDFENNVFESCMPVEVMAKRGVDTLCFGPMKPVGLIDERTGQKNHAVLQLRKENAEGTLYNLVGFQTHLKFPEQKRVFSLIPALKNAEFVRYGVMHRNTYINSPKFLNSHFQLKDNKNIYFAGQITGVEGYVESIASGLVAGLAVYANIADKKPVEFGGETIIGALCKHISCDFGNFSPMNANFGILTPLEHRVHKKEKKQAYADRSMESLKSIAENLF